LAILVALSMTALAQTKPVEITSEPGHHLALRNQYTRVFQVELAPRASTQLHLHRHNYLFVTIGPALIENDVQGKAPVKMKLLDGETELAPGPFAHVIKNLGNTPFRNVTIEILRTPSPAAQSQPQERGLSLDDGVAVQTLYDTAQVRVLEYQLNPGVHLDVQEDKWPHLLVAVSGLKLRDQRKGGRGVDFNQKPGDVSWSEGGHAHTFTNLGLHPARWIDVEFK
jgi:mannose-6-phosphate isomerase-like protein (cupin superfamily)